MPAKAIFNLPYEAMAVYLQMGPQIGLDAHQSAKIIRRTGRPDGNRQAC
jgi:hypothetical protein